MSTSEYLSKLSIVEKLACSSKWNRLLHNPWKYISAIVFKELVYPRSKKEILKRTRTFFDREILIALPASTDIFLVGAKSHDSEIRFARYLVRNLHKGQSFLDIGAHYGFFTMLASDLVGKKGRVYAFEPSRKTYHILSRNFEKNEHGNTILFHEAVSDRTEEISFYEFPNLYSEYNSTDAEQFSKETWFADYQPEKVAVQARTIDAITKADDFHPDFIKIDAEGAEYKVIKGAVAYLEQYSPQLIMEYLSPERGNAEHKKALKLLESHSYQPYVINKEGILEQVGDIDEYLAYTKLESDNIVFKKLH